ncbi:hypothetical protein D3C87_1049590 [compost metagenome]
MGNAVHGFVEGFGGQIVKQHDGGVVAYEVVLDREDLTAIAQGALRQQADLGQAVEHHARRLEPLDHFENLPGGFTQLKVRGVQQRLLMLGIEQVFRRRQFEDIDVVVQFPTVGARTLAQFALGFGQGDVQRALAGSGAGQ